MPPRRSHKKSRAGCRRCKARKIKCDEVHPRCTNCVKHGVPCDFEHPEIADEFTKPAPPATSSDAAASPAAATSPSAPSVASSSAGAPSQTSGSYGSWSAPTTPTAAGAGAAPPTTTPLYRSPDTAQISAVTPAGQRMLELRLMHHYTALTCKTVTFTSPVTEDIWKYTVPSLAFSGSQHLADAVLAVAALHLRSLVPHDRDLVRASHAYMAASLAEYSATLKAGITERNAEALFLTSALIAFQSTASRTFVEEENILAAAEDGPGMIDGREVGGGGLTDAGGAAAVTGGGGTASASSGGGGNSSSNYDVPFSWFHSFQGVKAVTAASWPYLRHSVVVMQIINSQAALQLDFFSGGGGFFDHLLDGLDEELATLDDPPPTDPDLSTNMTATTNAAPADDEKAKPLAAAHEAQRRRQRAQADATRQAYQHAVAVINWAHKLPQRGAALVFPATVSRRFVELLAERRPRALAVLACFFALLRSLDGVWWLRGMARREVLGVAGLFGLGHDNGNNNIDAPSEDAGSGTAGRWISAEEGRRWWPHLDWALRIALWENPAGEAGHDDGAGFAIPPPEVWGADWLAEEIALAGDLTPGQDFVSQIELLSQMAGSMQSLPAVPDQTALGQ